MEAGLLEAAREVDEPSYDGCGGELLVVLLILINICAALGFQGFAAIADAAASWYQVPVASINNVVVVAQASNLVSYALSSMLSDRGSIEACMVAGAVLAIVGALLRWLARGPGPQLFGLGLVGMGLSSSATSFFSCLAAPAAARHLRPSRRVLGTSLILLANLLGIGLGQAVVGGFEHNIPLLMLIELVAVAVPSIVAVVYALPRMKRRRQTFGDPAQPERPPYLPLLRRMAGNGPFVRLACGIALLIGTFNTFSALMDQVAPPSMDGHVGLALAAIFGCGLIGTVLQGVILGQTRNYTACTRVSISGLGVGWAVAAAGWYCNLQGLIWPGLCVVGFFGVGLLPLAVDLGVELCYEPSHGFEGTVNGIITASTTAWGLGSIYLTEPSTISKVVPTKDLIFVWCCMFVVGGLLVLSANRGELRRLAAEREEAERKSGTLDSLRSGQREGDSAG